MNVFYHEHFCIYSFMLCLCTTDTVMVHVTVNSIDTHHSIHIPATAKDVKPVIGNLLNEGKCYFTDVVIMSV